MLLRVILYCRHAIRADDEIITILFSMRKTNLIRAAKVERMAGFCLHKICLVAIAIVLSASEMTVSAAGGTEFAKATGTIYDFLAAIIIVILAITCLLSVFYAYSNIQKGEDVKKAIMQTIGISVASMALGLILP